jgi:hypothetical protein
MSMTPTQFGKFMFEETGKWAKVIKFAGIKQARVILQLTPTFSNVSYRTQVGKSCVQIRDERRAESGARAGAEDRCPERKQRLRHRRGFREFRRK